MSNEEDKPAAASGIIARTNALLRRNRPDREEPLARSDVHSDTAGEDDIPVLTDIAPDPELISGAENAHLPAARAGAQGVEVISRVQNQNLEHSQRLRKDFDSRVAEVVREHFMPDIG
ncbi:MAG TPA: hypothetical protein VGP15_20830, partial [Burkholderiales bacterium]|nr:hypothetical protein [Burkholderiales bacterium]